MGALFRIGWNFNITSACFEADSQRHNKSLDASGGSAFRNLLGAAQGALIRAAASTQPFDCFFYLI
jgi:hypothetical protein